MSLKDVPAVKKGDSVNVTKYLMAVTFLELNMVKT